MDCVSVLGPHMADPSDVASSEATAGQAALAEVASECDGVKLALLTSNASKISAALASTSRRSWE